MASSSSSGGVVLNKGDVVSVEVEESSTNIISVKVLVDGKRYRGILLQEDQSQYGVNPERVQGAPFWPPLNSSSGINLKATPCSTERYSCKFEGQPSALTVFQPDVIKRSNRNQPAPQLSRILRPRRFVCRKCKKSYHVEEENGVEMSSASLSLQIERSSQDVVVNNSDSETVPTSSSTASSSMSKTLRTSRSRLALSEDNPSAQSIRHVTPSIIPKMNDDYGLSGRESEADSNSDDAVVVRRKKPTNSEKPILPHEEQPPPPSGEAAVKSIVPAKRKAEVNEKLKRPKKVKRTAQVVSTAQPSLSLDGTDQPSIASESSVASCEAVAISENQKGPESIPPPPEQQSHLPVLSAKSTPVPPKPEDSMVRKNRIKAQYVSVATPFRFPPSRSSKPNLFANNPFVSPTKDKSSVQKRPRTSESLAKKNKPIPSIDSPGSPRKSNLSSSCTSSVDPLKSKKPTSPGTAIPIRSRTRTRSNVSTALDLNSDNKPSNHIEGGSQTIDAGTGSETTAAAAANVAIASNAQTTSEYSSTDTDVAVNHTEPHTCSTTASLQTATTHGPGSISTNVSTASQCAMNQSKSIDYEKPKNRWIREARARRTQEERLTGANVINTSTGSALITTPTCTVDSTGSSCVTSMSSPTLSRLRMRSGECASTTTGSPATNVSPKTSFSAKKRGNPLTVIIPDNPGTVFEEEQTKLSTTAIAAQPSYSPRAAAPNSDGSTGTGLPVLKIKINRQRPPSSTSSSHNTQYEVVEFQVSDADESRANKSNTQDPFEAVGPIALPDSSVDGSTEFKINASCNGSSTATASPSLSASSSRKGLSSSDPVGLGRLVKRCRLPDGVVFHVGDLVWSKLSGWPYWPAQITSIHQALTIEPDTEASCTRSASPQSGPKQVSYTACLHWFAWHQVSYMACDKLYHFMQHYKRFDNKKKRGVFRQAVNEARQAADEKRSAPSSPSDAESLEDDATTITTTAATTTTTSTTTYATTATINTTNTQTITIAATNNTETKIQPTTTVSIEQLNPTAVASQQEESSVTLEPPTSLPVSGTNVPLVGIASSSSTLLSETRETSLTAACDSLELSNAQPSVSAPTRRGASRGGRSRSLRGRRGGTVGSADRIRASPRNLPTFLSSPEQGSVKTPYDQFDEMDVVETQLPFRRQRASGGRGRGARNRETGNGGVGLSNRVSTALPSSIPTVEPVQSSGSLKIKLSTAHLRLPGVKKRQATKPKVSKRRVKSSMPVVEQSVQSTNPIPNAYIPSKESVLNTQSSVPSYSEQPTTTGASSTNTASVTFQTNYDDPSEAILSQFPHVFPDFRTCGILSDAVDIPTFSEDESEEEDAGRLIIDPEVMAAVNVSNSMPNVLTVPTPPSHITVLPRCKPESNMLIEAPVYSTPYFPSMPEQENPPTRNDLMNPLFERSSLIDPLRSRQPEPTLFGSAASLSSSSIHSSASGISITTNPSSSLYNLPSHPYFPGFRPPIASPISSVLPFPSGATNELTCASRSHTLDLFAPTLQPRTASAASYFRPSSHVGVVVPVTNPNAAVPYVTSEYPTR